MDFDFYGTSHEFKIFANDKLIFALKMPEYITEANCKAISGELNGGVDAVLAFFKEFLPS